MNDITNKTKLDLGSGPRDRWWKPYDNDVLHLDIEGFKGTTKWEAGDRIPVLDNSIQEAYVGWLLIEVDIQTNIDIAKELTRVMKKTGRILVTDYGNICNERENRNEKLEEDWGEFFETLRCAGWVLVKQELKEIQENPDGVYPLCLYLWEMWHQSRWPAEPSIKYYVPDYHEPEKDLRKIKSWEESAKE